MSLIDELPEEVRQRLESAKARVCIAIDKQKQSLEDMKDIKKEICTILDGVPGT